MDDSESRALLGGNGRQRGVVVDTFSFADPYRTLELNPSEIERLRGIVGSVAEGTKAVEDLLRGRPRGFIVLRPRGSNRP